MIYINDWCLNDYVDSVDEKLFYYGESPEIMYEDVTIPGRSGKLHLDLNRYEEKTIELPCWIRTDFRNRYRVLQSKLNALKGEITLRCTPSPEYWGDGYYTTVFKGKIATPTMGSFLKNGQFVLQFNVNPKYWLDLGQTASLPMMWMPSFGTSGSSTAYHTPNFTYTTGDTLKVLWIGTNTSYNSAVIRFLNSSGIESITDMSGATTAWANGEFFDITSVLSNGDIFYLELDDGGGSKWNIQTDIPTGNLETYESETAHTIYNPTPFEARPLFRIDAKYDDHSDPEYFTQFYLNNILVRIDTDYLDTHSGMPLFIDSELQDCYYIDGNGEKQNANAYVSLIDRTTGSETTEFPVIVPGENEVNSNYGDTLYFLPMSTWTITPRWYII